ncbi:MAG: hypothetical protein H0U95_04940 [Bacteroidetes bacterium]|nr:hypothetical protein [Bacteroidota bacterium]
MSKFKKGDFVKWLIGDDSQYTIVATKEDHHINEKGEKIEIEHGNDFLIVKTPIEDGKFGGFQHVPAQHLEFFI